MTHTPTGSNLTRLNSGADPGGGGGLEVRTPPFGRPPNFIKREKTSLSARKRRILVLHSYPDPPLSEILSPPLDSTVELGNVSWPLHDRSSTLEGQVSAFGQHVT